MHSLGRGSLFVILWAVMMSLTPPDITSASPVAEASPHCCRGRFAGRGLAFIGVSI